MVVRRLAQLLVRLGHVDRDALGRPHVVVVDAGSHHEHEGVVRPDLRRLDGLDLERVLGLAVAIGTDQVGVHLGGDLADRRNLADLVQLLGHRDLRA